MAPPRSASTPAREQATVGPSSFDVGIDGSVRILDQVNRRLATYRPGRAGQPARVAPLAISGAMADLATGADRTRYVLDQGRGGPATVRVFDPSGRALGSTALPRGTSAADQLRTSPDGLVAHQYPDEEWLPAGAPGGHSMSAAERAAAAHAGRPVALPHGGHPSKRRAADSGEVVIRALPHEARAALVRGTTVVAAWRLRSSTDLGEIGLAELFGNGLVMVVRVWTETRAEQQVVRLGARGVDSTFAVDRAEWAQALASSRFRLGQDGRLYQLRTSSSGVQVAAGGSGGVDDQPPPMSRLFPGGSGARRLIVDAARRCRRRELRCALLQPQRGGQDWSLDPGAGQELCRCRRR